MHTVPYTHCVYALIDHNNDETIIETTISISFSNHTYTFCVSIYHRPFVPPGLLDFWHNTVPSAFEMIRSYTKPVWITQSGALLSSSHIFSVEFDGMSQNARATYSSEVAYARNIEWSGIMWRVILETTKWKLHLKSEHGTIVVAWDLLLLLFRAFSNCCSRLALTVYYSVRTRLLSRLFRA